MKARRRRWMTVGLGGARPSLMLPLQPNQIPSCRFSAALTATARPPAWRGPSGSGTATRFETRIRRDTGGGPRPSGGQARQPVPHGARVQEPPEKTRENLLSDAERVAAESDRGLEPGAIDLLVGNEDRLAATERLRRHEASERRSLVEAGALDFEDPPPLDQLDVERRQPGHDPPEPLSQVVDGPPHQPMMHGDARPLVLGERAMKLGDHQIGRASCRERV